MNNSHNAQEPRCTPLSATEAPAIDVEGVRRAAQEGLLVMPGQVLALLDRIEALEEAAEGFLQDGERAETDLADLRLAYGHLFIEMEETRAALDYWRNGEAMRDLAEAGRQLREMHALVMAARAWADAVERQQGVEEAAQELRAAIRRLNQ